MTRRRFFDDDFPRFNFLDEFGRLTPEYEIEDGVEVDEGKYVGPNAAEAAEELVDRLLGIAGDSNEDGCDDQSNSYSFASIGDTARVDTGCDAITGTPRNSTMAESVKLILVQESIGGYTEPPTLRRSGDTLANIFVFAVIENASSKPYDLSKHSVTMGFRDQTGRMVYVDQAFSVNSVDSCTLPPQSSMQLVMRFHVPSQLWKTVRASEKGRLQLGTVTTDILLAESRVLAQASVTHSDGMA